MSKSLRSVSIVGVLLFGVITVLANSEAVVWGWRSGNIQRSKLVGNSIVEKLFQFQAVNGRYPRRLDELIPMYLQSIPAPCAGEKTLVLPLYGIRRLFRAYFLHAGKEGLARLSVLFLCIRISDLVLRRIETRVTFQLKQDIGYLNEDLLKNIMKRLGGQIRNARRLRKLLPSPL